MCYCLIKSCFCFSLKVGTGIMLYLKLLHNILVFVIPIAYPVANKYIGSTLEVGLYFWIFLTAQTLCLLLGILRFHFNISAFFEPLQYVLLFQLVLVASDVGVIIFTHYNNEFNTLCKETQGSQEETVNGCLFIAILFHSEFTILRIIFNILAQYVFYSYYKIVELREPVLVSCGICDVTSVKMTEKVEEANNNVGVPPDNNNVSEAPNQSEENVASEVPTRRRFSGVGLRIPCSSFWIWCVGLTASSKVTSK